MEIGKIISRKTELGKLGKLRMDKKLFKSVKSEGSVARTVPHCLIFF
jgi:hypothetical protein